MHESVLCTRTVFICSQEGKITPLELNRHDSILTLKKHLCSKFKFDQHFELSNSAGLILTDETKVSEIESESIIYAIKTVIECSCFVFNCINNRKKR